jgi:hypothetical protein
MTTTLEHTGSFADTGESFGDRKAFLDALVAYAGNAAVGATYHEEGATGQNQFPQTD